MRTIIRRFCFFIINNLILFRPFMALFNYCYERAPYNIVVYLFRHVVIPNKDFNWTIRLDNKNKVLTPIRKNRPNTQYFGMTYRWHDPSLNKIETVLLDYLPHDAIWIDCGANLGLRALAPLSTRMKVYMIEPNNETNAQNIERCKLNNFSNYELLTFGVSNTDTEKTFYIDSSTYLSSLNRENIDEKNIVSAQTIQVRKLDTLFREQINAKVKAHIKIDVEGHEKEVLEGAENLINTLSPSFLIEINTKGDHIKTVFEMLRNKGYKIYEKSEQIVDSKFLRVCPDDTTNYNFTSNDFLFVRDEALIKRFETFII